MKGEERKTEKKTLWDFIKDHPKFREFANVLHHLAINTLVGIKRTRSEANQEEEKVQSSNSSYQPLPEKGAAMKSHGEEEEVCVLSEEDQELKALYGNGVQVSRWCYKDGKKIGGGKLEGKAAQKSNDTIQIKGMQYKYFSESESDKIELVYNEYQKNTNEIFFTYLDIGESLY